MVFDGSAKSDTGVSLNDILHVGPNIQEELFSILTRFRTHKVAFIADIEKMYRQIKVVKDQFDLQRIVWRDRESDKLKHFQLNTITYGIAPASFLATRCLVQLAEEFKNDFPVACNSIKRNFYVDDLLTGTETLEAAIKLKTEIELILKSAGFTLRKFVSSHSSLFENTTNPDGGSVDNYVISDSDQVKALGILWRSDLDLLQFQGEQKEKFYQQLQKYLIPSVS